MKKTLLILSALALVFSARVAHAQLINPGFETWTQDLAVPTAMNPNSGNGTTGWCDYNFFNSAYVGSSPISVIRCTDTVRSGSYSVRLQTKVYTPTSWNYYKNWGIPFIGHIYSDTLGILFTGNENETTVSYLPGIPCNQKLTQFSFYYQYKPNGNDTAECRVLLVNQRTPVAGGWFKSNVATGASGWQHAVVNLTYTSLLTPDTLWVLFSSSSLDRNPKPGSVLWLDDASVTLPLGINEALGAGGNVEIFPNPSNGIFSIQQLVTNNEKQLVEIYNVLGEKIYSTINNKQATCNIDISQSPKGIYFVKLYDGEKIRTEKIVVQ